MFEKTITDSSFKRKLFDYIKDKGSSDFDFYDFIEDTNLKEMVEKEIEQMKKHIDFVNSLYVNEDFLSLCFENSLKRNDFEEFSCISNYFNKVQSIFNDCESFDTKHNLKRYFEDNNKKITFVLDKNKIDKIIYDTNNYVLTINNRSIQIEKNDIEERSVTFFFRKLNRTKTKAHMNYQTGYFQMKTTPIESPFLDNHEVVETTRKNNNIINSCFYSFDYKLEYSNNKEFETKNEFKVMSIDSNRFLGIFYPIIYPDDTQYLFFISDESYKYHNKNGFNFLIKNLNSFFNYDVFKGNFDIDHLTDTIIIFEKFGFLDMRIVNDNILFIYKEEKTILKGLKEELLESLLLNYGI